MVGLQTHCIFCNVTIKQVKVMDWDNTRVNILVKVNRHVAEIHGFELDEIVEGIRC